MKTSVLLITTTTPGLGPARMPKALFDAGFEVSLLAPANSLAEKSRFIARVGHLPDAATDLAMDLRIRRDREGLLAAPRRPRRRRRPAADADARIDAAARDAAGHTRRARGAA